MFSLMFAGHGTFSSIISLNVIYSDNSETTASGIVTTLAYLALFPEEQQKAWLEVSRAFPDGLTSVHTFSRLF